MAQPDDLLVGGEVPEMWPVRVARWVLLTVFVAVVVAGAAGCSVAGTFGALGDAGFSVSAVSSQSSGGVTTLQVTASSPPGLPRAVAVDRAERVLWGTQRSRIDRLELDLDGVETTATRDELTARFGPRDPALEASNVDLILLISIFGGVGLVVVVAIVVVVVVTVRRRRRLRGGGVGLDPLWEPTDLVGARVGQFVVDYLLWWVPTVLGMVAIVWSSTLGGPGDRGRGVLVVFAVVGWLVLAIGWGWFTYAYRPARRQGQTVGMRLLGLRVVALDGSPAGLGAHTLRWLLFLVETSFAGLIGLLIMSLSPRHQRLGDMVAGTVVVRAQRAAAPSVPTSPGGGSPPGWTR